MCRNFYFRSVRSPGLGSAYGRFLAFSVVSALLWVGLLVCCGYLFGSIPAVQENFGLVNLAIVAFSIAPLAFEYARARLRR